MNKFNLRTLRLTQGWTVKELALALYVSPTSIRDWERKHRCPHEEDYIAKVLIQPKPYVERKRRTSLEELFNTWITTNKFTSAELDQIAKLAHTSSGYTPSA